MCALHVKLEVMKEFIVYESQTAYVKWRLYLQIFGYWDFSSPRLKTLVISTKQKPLGNMFSE